MSAPAGWYPDPSSPETQLRLWDGAAWTEQVRPAVPYGAAAPPRRGVGRIVALIAAALILTQVLPVVLGTTLLGAILAGLAKTQEHSSRPGGKYNPLEVEQGQAFGIDDLRYAAGWRVVPDGHGRVTITGLQATNVGTERASVNVVVSLTSPEAGVVESSCSSPLVEPRGTAPVTCTAGRVSPSAPVPDRDSATTWERISVSSLG